jgi:hypothetical protein
VGELGACSLFLDVLVCGGGCGVPSVQRARYGFAVQLSPRISLVGRRITAPTHETQGCKSLARAACATGRAGSAGGGKKGGMRSGGASQPPRLTTTRS